MPRIIFTGYSGDLNKIALTKLLHGQAGLQLADAKALVDRLLEGYSVEVSLPRSEDAAALIEAATSIGAFARHDEQYHIQMPQDDVRAPAGTPNLTEEIGDLERVYQKTGIAALPPGDLGPGNRDSKVTAEAFEKVYELLTISPRAAIIEAWLLVEDAILVAAEHNEVTIGNRRSVASILKILADLSIVPRSVVPLTSKLNSVRNAAVHAKEFRMELGISAEYIDLARRIVDVARAVTTVVQRAA